MDTNEMIAWARKLGPAPLGKSATSVPRADFGRAKEVRSLGRDAKGYWVRRDWYVPESFGDDDEANGSSPLAARMGSTRVEKELYAESYEAAIARIPELG